MANKLLYIFDYDDTLKSEEGMCPDDNVFIELVDLVKTETGLPMVILTSGLARAYDSTIFTIDRSSMRPVDYVRSIGLKYTENTFDIKVDVCVFDARHRSPELERDFGKPLIDQRGKKILASLNFLIFMKYKFNTDMILFDDLDIHIIDPNPKTPIGFSDPFVRSRVVYLQVKKLGKSQKDSCERIKLYSSVVSSGTIDRKSGIFTIVGYRGSELLVKII